MTTIPVPDTTTPASTLPAPPPSPDAPHQPGVYTARILSIRELRDYTQHLTGSIKTLIDASISDLAQRKALKDILHRMIWTEHYSAALEWAEKEYYAEVCLLGNLGTQSWEDVIANVRSQSNINPNAIPAEPFPFSYTPIPIAE